jgi:hypothetical protein
VQFSAKKYSVLVRNRKTFDVWVSREEEGERVLVSCFPGRGSPLALSMSVYVPSSGTEGSNRAACDLNFSPSCSRRVSWSQDSNDMSDSGLLLLLLRSAYTSSLICLIP